MGNCHRVLQINSALLPLPLSLCGKALDVMMLSLRGSSLGSFLFDTATKMFHGSNSLNLSQSFAAVVTHKCMDVVTDFKS